MKIRIRGILFRGMQCRLSEQGGIMIRFQRPGKVRFVIVGMVTVFFLPANRPIQAQHDIELPWFDMDPVTVMEAWPELMNSDLVPLLAGNLEEIRPYMEQALVMLNQADWSELVEAAGPAKELIERWGDLPALQPWAAELQSLYDYLSMAEYVERVPPVAMEGEPAGRTSSGGVGTAARAGGSSAGRTGGGKVGTAARVGTAAKAAAGKMPQKAGAAKEKVTVQDKEQALSSVERWRQLLQNRPIPSGASRYEDMVKKVFAGHGLPPELVWMAEVESAWNPKAESPVGAKGLFQLMPETARSLGLNVGNNSDDRVDPRKNADAAARYLKKLHQRFGSWDLAVAAYNGGEGRVSRAMKSAGARQGFSKVSGKLPRETRMYVPKVFVTIGLREKIDPGGLPTPANGPVAIPTAMARHSDPVPITLN
jgi:hypothetical protein